MIEGKERVVAYASRILPKTEEKYYVTCKELLLVATYVKYFRHYMYGREFTVWTDQISLPWLKNFKNPEGQWAKWLKTLAMFNMKHKQNSRHCNADALSWKACKKCILMPEYNDANNTFTGCTGSTLEMTPGDNEEEKHLSEHPGKDIKSSKVKSWLEQKVRLEPLKGETRTPEIIVGRIDTEVSVVPKSNFGG